MDQDHNRLLQKTYELAQENNKLLKGMRRSQRIATIMRVVYWLVILGAAGAAFYYLQPFVEPFLDSYSAIRDNFSNFSNLIN